MIITNHDIIRESKYLKLLNPDLLSLIKMNYLIFLKILNINIKKEINGTLIQVKSLINQNVLKDLYNKLNFKNQSDFELNLLKIIIIQFKKLKKNYKLSFLE